MFTYEIKKPGFINRVLSLGTPTPTRSSQQQQPRRPQTGNAPFYYGKLEYANWLRHVMMEWPVGTLCSLSALSPVPGREPIPLFKVVNHHQIHWSSPCDERYADPRGILVVSVERRHPEVAYSPSALRKLTAEELTIVHLRNKETTPPVIQREDGAFVDSITGELL